MTDKELTIKKPSKKERLLARRAEREKMVNVTTKDVQLTLDCPKCHERQYMTLAEYFEKAQYDGVKVNNSLYCETCIPAPKLVFYKAPMNQIRLAGLNWQREKMGISKAEMGEKIEAVEQVSLAAKKMFGKSPKAIPEEL